MKFSHQQWLIAGLGLSVISLNFFISADLSIVGAPLVLLPLVRWLFRLVALSSLHDSLAQSRGYSSRTLFVASDFSKLNRWFFHVDEFGVDLDLKEKLKSKATND